VRKKGPIKLPPIGVNSSEESIFKKSGKIPELNVPEDGEEKAKRLLELNQIKLAKQNNRVARALLQDIKSENETLKYEYIEMVKNGLEKEFLYYLLRGI
jgi:hypothetical protein